MALMETATSARGAPRALRRDPERRMIAGVCAGLARYLGIDPLFVRVGLSVIFAPWIARLVRSLSAERAERIRSQERAEMAAHLHDSVLQTLALMQKRAGDPRRVAALARRQERELRAWLSDG